MTVPNALVDRLRAQLRAAGIPLPEADLEGMLDRGVLEGVHLFEGRAAGGEGFLPDYIPAEPSGDAARAGLPARQEGDAAADARDRIPVPPQGRGEIAVLAARIRSGETSPVELAQRAFARIAEREGELNAFQLVLEERALGAARRAEAELAAGRDRGTLHGIPVAIKDLLDLSGTPTTAGSRILAGRPAEGTAPAVARLEAAGAVIVGKTRMSEFAYFPGSANAHYGATPNPHDRSRDAGGSSSGSAVAVAAGIVPAAVGSDSGGSIRIPAALCGVVGFKPTYGRVPTEGAVPLSWSVDHLGPLTRTVADAALLFAVMAGEDPRAYGRASRDGPGSAVSAGGAGTAKRAPGGAASPTEPAPAPGVQELRIGIVEEDGSGEPVAGEEAWRASRAALARLEAAGAELVPVAFPEIDDLWRANTAILATEALAFHREWLRTRLSDYGEIPRQRILAGFAYGPDAFVRAQRLRRRCRDALLARMAGIDLLALPTQPGGAPLLGVSAWTRPTAPFNALGWPALSVPVGRTVQGLPLALQLVGRVGADLAVLRAGMALETV